MVYLLIGRRKRGKTTLAYYMVRKSERRIIFDPRGMVPDSGRSLRVFTARDFTERAVPALEDREIDQVVYVPTTDDLSAPLVTFSNELKRWVTDHPIEPLGVMIDELGWIETAQARDPKSLRRALRDCEPELLNVFITCHRPSDVPVNTRSIADYWALFHCVQEHDLDVIRERCNNTVATVVQTLEARAFVLYDDAEGNHKLYPDGSSWYVPLRRGNERRGVSGPLDDISGQDVRKPLDARLPL